MKAIDHVGPGWAPFVQILLDELQRDGVKILQVKEKFGQLRVYGKEGEGTNVPHIETLIRAACYLASHTCATCGKEGELRSDLDWKQVLCEEHYTEEVDKYV